MEINIKPELEAIILEAATGQRMTLEAYAQHVLEKYAVSQIRTKTVELLPSLSVDELLQVKVNMDAVVEAKKEAERIAGESEPIITQEEKEVGV